MVTYTNIEKTTTLLKNHNLAWLLPILRQDSIIWSSLNDLEFFDLFSRSLAGLTEVTPEDFSPCRLALLELGQSIPGKPGLQNLLNGIDNQVLQLAIHGFNDQTVFQTQPFTLVNTGLITLALAYKYVTTGTWRGLLETLEDMPEVNWHTSLACLYTFTTESDNLLNALVQPEATPLRIELAVHAVLCNPSPTDKQIEMLMDLCYGAYGDMLPARERTLLLQSMVEQRPDIAAGFSTRWHEEHPEKSRKVSKLYSNLLENLQLTAENHFEIEIHRLAKNTQGIPQLLVKEVESARDLSASLINQHVLNLSRVQPEKSLVDEITSLNANLIQPDERKGDNENFSARQAMLALSLLEKGCEAEAQQLLPTADTSMAEDPTILYALARFNRKFGNIQFARDAAKRLVTHIETNHLISSLPVWGDYLSLMNLGELLHSLHEPEEASQILELASGICPNDTRILKLLAACYKDSKKLSEAAQVLKVIVALDPMSLEDHREYAQVLEELGNWTIGLSERTFIKEFLKTNNKDIPLQDIYSYANCALNANQPDLALDICSGLLSRTPEDSQALIFMGRAQLMTNEVDKGLEFLLRATQVSPDRQEAWLTLAEAQKKIYPLRTVIDTLSNASQAVPDSSLVHYQLGELYLQDDTPSLALPELESAVRLSPDEPKVLVSYARALSLLGHNDESCKAYARAYQLEPAYPGLALQYAKILVARGALEEAISPLEALISSKSADDPNLYLEYARCVLSLYKSGSSRVAPMNALVALNEVLQRDPELAEAKALVAESLAANGDKEMAFQAYREALDTTLIEDQIWLERLSYGFGCVAASLGKHDIAIAALQEASHVNPNNPTVDMVLSDAYLAAGLPEDGIRAARNVLVIDGENPGYLSWFANQVSKFVQMDKPAGFSASSSTNIAAPSEALTALNKAIQLAPTRTDLLIQLGNLQASMGASEKAHDTFADLASMDFAAIEDLISASDYLSGVEDHLAAISCLENAANTDSQNDQHDPSLYRRLAQEYLKNNDPSSAINALDRALIMLPGEGSFINQKIDILLNQGQSIEALSCIEKTLQQTQNGSLNSQLCLLASKIHHSKGDFSAAVSYIRKGIGYSARKNNDPAGLPPEYTAYLAEIYRTLIQPELANSILQGTIGLSASDFSSDESYINFVCLHTELAMGTCESIRPDFTDLQLEPSHKYFARWMAIKARLMNKAGNFKQAEQILRIAQKASSGLDHATDPRWTDASIKLQTLNSVLEACLDLGEWDQAENYGNQIREGRSGEPQSYLYYIKRLTLEAEFNNLCTITEACTHQSLVDPVSMEHYSQVEAYLDQTRSVLETYKADVILPEFELTDSEIYRWQARAAIAFNHDVGTDPEPSEVLTQPLSPGDAAAKIYRLHQLDLRDPNSDSFSRMIKVARSYPRNPAVIFQVALAIHDDNPADAMKSLQSVIEQNPYSKIPMIAFCSILLAKIAMNMDQLDVAHRAVENALDIWPDEPVWHSLAAVICQRSSDGEGAINHLMEATRLAPENAPYHMELGKIYFDTAGDDPHILRQAFKSFENVMRLDPSNVSALISIARIQYFLGDLENAESNARSALILAPNRADIYQLLSEIAMRVEDYMGAYEYANKAIQLSPKDVQSTIILARSLSALGKHTDALARLNTMVPAVPDARALHLERVSIVRKTQGSRAGLIELKNIANEYPDDFSVLNALAKSYVEVGELENAAETAEKALQSCTENTSRNERANLHLLIGQVLRQSGQIDQSILHLNEAIQYSPERLEPYLELGLARKERREYQQALLIFEQATSIAPEDPRALFQAGMALKESKDYKGSETMLRRAVSLAPNDLMIRRQLAAVVALNLIHNPRTVRNQA